MKNITVFIITTLLVFATFQNCGGKKRLGFKEHGLDGKTITWVSQKWYDKGNTFALRVYALPVLNYINKTQAMVTCSQALRVNAGAQIVGFFNGVETYTASDTKNGQLQKMATTASSSGIVKGMRLYEITMVQDDPSQGCTAMAVISRKGLKQSVNAGAFKN